LGDLSAVALSNTKVAIFYSYYENSKYNAKMVACEINGTIITIRK